MQRKTENQRLQALSQNEGIFENKNDETNQVFHVDF